MRCNIGEFRNLFLNLKPELGLHQVAHTTPRIILEKFKLADIEMQLLPLIEKTDSEEEISSLKITIKNGRRKVYVNFKTCADNLNTVVYRCLKDIGLDLKLTEYQSLWTKPVYLLSYLDLFYKRSLVLVEATVHK